MEQRQYHRPAMWLWGHGHSFLGLAVVEAGRCIASAGHSFSALCRGVLCYGLHDLRSTIDDDILLALVV